MDKRIFDELTKQYAAMDKPTAAMAEEVALCIGILSGLSEIARFEGLIALEEATEKVSGILHAKYLKEMMALVIDGTGQEDILDMGLIRYYADKPSGIDAVEYLVILSGVLMVQSGTYPTTLETRLFSLSVPDTNEAFKTKKAEADKMLGITETDTMAYEAMFHTGVAAAPGDGAYFPMKLADYAVRTLDEKSLTKLLEAFGHSKIAETMKGLSDVADKRILSALPKDMSQDITREYCKMGPVRIKDIADDVMHLLKTVITLADSNVIKCPDLDAYKLFDRLFKGETEGTNGWKIYSEMLDLMKEYEEGYWCTTKK